MVKLKLQGPLKRFNLLLFIITEQWAPSAEKKKRVFLKKVNFCIKHKVFYKS